MTFRAAHPAHRRRAIAADRIPLWLLIAIVSLAALIEAVLALVTGPTSGDASGRASRPSPTTEL